MSQAREEAGERRHLAAVASLEQRIVKLHETQDSLKAEVDAGLQAEGEGRRELAGALDAMTPRLDRLDEVSAQREATREWVVSPVRVPAVEESQGLRAAVEETQRQVRELLAQQAAMQVQVEQQIGAQERTQPPAAAQSPAPAPASAPEMSAAAVEAMIEAKASLRTFPPSRLDTWPL